MLQERWARLGVWRLADEMAFKVYRATRTFPKDESYGITSQLRRCSLSIPTDIVEGCSRKGDKEMARFLNIALGSLGETKYLLYFSERLGYLKNQEHGELHKGYAELGRMLWKFYEKVKQS